MAPAWHDYQVEAAEFFRSLGLTAHVDAKVGGIRTSHDVDVLVVSEQYGLFVRWIVDTKLWKTNVTKAQVLALRSIVDDTGADRGFLLSEKGFQKGATEAARSTNVTLTSLADLRSSAQDAIEGLAVAELDDRAYRMDRRLSALLVWGPTTEKRGGRGRVTSGKLQVRDERYLGISGRVGLLGTVIDKVRRGQPPPFGVPSLDREHLVGVKSVARFVVRANAFLDEVEPLLTEWEQTASAAASD